MGVGGGHTRAPYENAIAPPQKRMHTHTHAHTHIHSHTHKHTQTHTNTHKHARTGLRPAVAAGGAAVVSPLCARAAAALLLWRPQPAFASGAAWQATPPPACAPQPRQHAHALPIKTTIGEGGGTGMGTANSESKRAVQHTKGEDDSSKHMHTRAHAHTPAHAHTHAGGGCTHRCSSSSRASLSRW